MPGDIGPAHLVRALQSTAFWAAHCPDYEAAIRQAGLNDLVEVHPQTGWPVSPEIFSPRLRGIWLRHPDPGAFAYTLATALNTGRLAVWLQTALVAPEDRAYLRFLFLDGDA